MVGRFWFVCDDAFISFRYARNWAEGNGLRYNLGDHTPVEGYSNFLWVVVSAIAEWFQADVTLVPILVSILCGTLLLYLVYDDLLRRCDVSFPVAWLAALGLACAPPFAVWSTSGLETMAFALLVYLSFQRLVLRGEVAQPILAAFAGLGLSLIRTEGVYWFILIVGVAAIGRRIGSRAPQRPLVVACAIALTGYAIYFAARFSYYDAFFANTTYAKVSLSAQTLVRGLRYLAIQYSTLLVPLLAWPGCVFALRRERRPLGLPIALMALAFPAYAVVVSGDFMAMGRLLVPALAFNTVLLAWLLQEVWRRPRDGKRWAVVGAIAVLLISLLPAWNLHLVPKGVRQQFHFRLNQARYLSEWEMWREMVANAAAWGDKGRALRSIAEPGDSMVAGAIGAVGYYSRLYVYDQAGLVNRDVARREVSGSLDRSPGHDKGVDGSKFFLPERPTFLRVRYAADFLPGGLVGRIRAEAVALWSKGVDELYVIDFVPYPGDAPGPQQRYLVVWRSIDPGVQAAEAWRSFEARLAALAMGG
jgi:arabinofuranosyltransferase